MVRMRFSQLSVSLVLSGLLMVQGAFSFLSPLLIPPHHHATARLFVASKPTGSEILSEAATASSQLFTPFPEDPSNDLDEVEVEGGDVDDTECLAGTEDRCLPMHLVTLPRHTHPGVNAILEKTETILRNIHVDSKEFELSKVHMAKEAGRMHERIYANNYVDLGKIDM